MHIPSSHSMTGVRYDLRGPVSQLAERMERSGIDVIKLNTGNPAAFGFETPPPILDVLRTQAQMAAAYSSTQGIWAAREAVCAYADSRGIRGLTPERVFTGNGVSELIQLSLQALLNPGDEVLIPTPDYPLWTAAVRLMGGAAVHYRCLEQRGWQPDLQDMEAKITPRTRAIVVISPNNPTGAVYPKGTLLQIAELARRNGLLLMSDEIYDRLVMDSIECASIASLAPDVPCVTYNGLSKSHQICGFRCGWMTLSGELGGAQGYLDALTTLSSMRLCSNVLAQAAIAPALQTPEFAFDQVKPGGRLYEQREVAYRMLSAIPGVSVVKAQAGLYMFPKLDLEALRIRDDEQFVLDLLRAEHVLLTAGSAYNWDAPDHFRVVYLPRAEVLSDVLTRLGQFLAGYRQY